MTRRKDPVNLYCSLALVLDVGCVGKVGGYDPDTPVFGESLVKYHPFYIKYLTVSVKPDMGQCQVGGLTGAVASQRVTEARKGSLSMIGNHA